MTFSRSCTYLGNIHRALCTRINPAASSALTKLILILQIWLIYRFGPVSVPSCPLRMSLFLIHLLSISSFHFSIGTFTCLFLYFSSGNFISFWFSLCLSRHPSHAYLCVPQQLARWLATWHRVRASGRGSDSELTGSATNLAICCLRPAMWKMVSDYLESEVPWRTQVCQ